jgi:uncharacterized protein YkwD
MHPNRCWLVVALFCAASLSVTAADKDDKPLKLSREEKSIVDLTNAARAKEKLPALKPNPLLFAAARAHAVNMAKQKKLEHVLDGKAPAERVKATGYLPKSSGENVALTVGLAPQTAFRNWMKSPGHKGNILDKEYDEIGVGVARGSDGKYYYCQVFGMANPADTE